MSAPLRPLQGSPAGQPAGRRHEHIYSQPEERPLVAAPSDVQGAEQTTTMVELSLSCIDLPDCDIVSKSDPQIFVYLLDAGGGAARGAGEQRQRCEIGRTELIADNLNPKFARKILINYHFEQIQRLQFEVFDIDPVGGNDFLGGLETSLGEIVADKSSAFKRPLVGGPKRRKPAYLVVDVEELTSCKQLISFNLRAVELEARCCGLLSPRASLHIYRSNENGSYTIVQRSASPAASRNPGFKPLELKLVTLCNGDLDRAIRFELLDQRLGLERQLGAFETTVNELKAGRGQQQVFELLAAGAGGRRRAGAGSAKVLVSELKLVQQASFLDYIRAGAQIHFVIAVDFTASNGDPAYPESLHYLDPLERRLNAYEAALVAVGEVIKPYDTVGMFAGFGFGAKLEGPSRPPAHLFALNGRPQQPYVRSLEELLAAYRSKLASVILSGPTNFAPCIAHCAQISRQFDDGNHYFVLLIVTDGIISDMSRTRRAIVEASEAPMSIIICGVGSADFGPMRELDSDDALLSQDGKSAQRDIVQFVPMAQFVRPDGARSAAEARQAQRLLAEEVLREIPDQLTGYMLAHGFHGQLTQPAAG